MTNQDTAASYQRGQGHTPGPWVASNSHQGVGWRVESDARGYPNDGWVICSDMLGPDNDANAHLIAAAPDMLAALQALNAGARPSNWDDDDLDEGERDAWRQLDAALSKALSLADAGKGVGRG